MREKARRRRAQRVRHEYEVLAIVGLTLAVLLFILFGVYKANPDTGAGCMIVGLVAVFLFSPRDILIIARRGRRAREGERGRGTQAGILAEQRGRELLARLIGPEETEIGTTYGVIRAGELNGKPVYVDIDTGAVEWSGGSWCIKPRGHEKMPVVDTVIANLLHARTNPHKLIATAYPLGTIRRRG